MSESKRFAQAKKITRERAGMAASPTKVKQSPNCSENEFIIAARKTTTRKKNFVNSILVLFLISFVQLVTIGTKRSLHR